MFERLQLKDFQAHARLSLDLAPGVTAIVGPSDIGKSAVMRALRWVCLNQPDGDEFRRWGAAGVAVRLVLDGGRTVTRSRHGTDNIYKLDDEEFKAFGRGGIPDTVAGLLKVTEANFQSQLDGPFWLSETPGEVSRQLNAVVDLGCIDTALAAAARRVAAARAAEEAAGAAMQAARKSREGLQWVAAAEAAYRRVDAAAVAMRRAIAASGELRAARDAATAAAAVVVKAQAKASATAAVLTAAIAAGKAGKQRAALAALVADGKQQAATAARRGPPVDRLDYLKVKADAAILYAEARREIAVDLEDARHIAKRRQMTSDAAALAKYDLEEAAADGCPICGGPLNIS